MSENNFQEYDLLDVAVVKIVKIRSKLGLVKSYRVRLMTETLGEFEVFLNKKQIIGKLKNYHKAILAYKLTGGVRKPLWSRIEPYKLFVL